jgi:hypothetical protein
MIKSIVIHFIIAFNLLLINSQVFAQCNIPNPGFENWGTTFPTGWTPIHPSNSTAISKTTDSYTGNYAVKFDTS